MKFDIKLSDYTYHLPDERIAKFPLVKRDESKLQVYQKGEIRHEIFKNIGNFLPEKTLLVFNNTRVIPARILFQKPSGAVIQLFLLHPILPTPVINLAMEVKNSCVWEAMIGNRKRWKNEPLFSDLIVKGQALRVTATLENSDKNWVKLSWNSDEISFVDLIQEFGKLPIPPYLNRETEEADYETYQTVYSEKKGAVAAPTAGLHFTQNVLELLSNQGVGEEFITLHVGAGTFQPIKVEQIVEHKMHNEQVVFTRKNVENLLQNVNTIIPVGTTSMRALESLYWYGVDLFLGKKEGRFFVEKLDPYQYETTNLPSPSESLEIILAKMNAENLAEIVGETEIFIFPSYQFKFCKGLITNYHQPESTLILLVAALIGEDWRKVYQEAMTKDYRFLSYGDSSLLLP